MIVPGALRERSGDVPTFYSIYEAPGRLDGRGLLYIETRELLELADEANGVAVAAVAVCRWVQIIATKVKAVGIGRI